MSGISRAINPLTTGETNYPYGVHRCQQSHCSCGKQSERFGNNPYNPYYFHNRPDPNRAQRTVNSLQRDLWGLNGMLPLYDGQSARYLKDYMSNGLYYAGYHPATVASAATNLYNQQQSTRSLGVATQNLAQAELMDESKLLQQQRRGYPPKDYYNYP